MSYGDGFKTVHVRGDIIEFTQNETTYIEEWFEPPDFFKRVKQDNEGNKVVFLFRKGQFLQYSTGDDPNIAREVHFEPMPRFFTLRIDTEGNRSSPVEHIKGRRAFAFESEQKIGALKRESKLWLDTVDGRPIKAALREYSLDGRIILAETYTFDFDVEISPDIFQLPPGVEVIEGYILEVTVENLLENRIFPTDRQDRYQAINILEDALHSDENEAQISRKLGELYAVVGDLDKAINYTEDSVEIEPSHEKYKDLAIFLFTKWRLTAENEFKKEAVAAIDNAVQLAPLDFFTNYEAAQLYEKLGKHQKALLYYEKALTLLEGFDPPHKEYFQEWEDQKKQVQMEIERSCDRVLSLLLQEE